MAKKKKSGISGGRMEGWASLSVWGGGGVGGGDGAGPRSLATCCAGDGPHLGTDLI